MKGWILIGFALAVGCEEQPKADDTPTDDPSGISKRPVDTQKPANTKAVDGPDCKTFAKEVRQACSDHYSKGLDVNCNTLIAQVTTTVLQTEGKEEMCARMGSRLRTKVAAAKSAVPGPNCVALGKTLDEKCFDKIGETPYPPKCNALIIATTKWREGADKLCENQRTMAKNLLK
mgnify:CR=1 FL=1